MSDTNFTKSLWNIYKKPKSNMITIISEIDGDIAYLFRYHNDNITDKNATLIALAPELYEALYNITNQTVMTEYNAHCFLAARKALSRAREE